MTLLLCILLGAGNHWVESFSEAKRIAAPLYTHTFYCGCPLTREGRRLSFDPAPCGYVPRRDNERAHRVEWEHVVPAARLGEMFSEHRLGHPGCVRTNGQPYRGRKCAERTNPRYRRILADLYNLRPAVGELNGDRSNKPVGLIDGEPRQYGRCDFETNTTTVEPPAAQQGNVARTYLYMDTTYGPFLTEAERLMFAQMDAADPVDMAECRWAREVALVQHNQNHVVEQRCWERGY